jgi:D-3-phosphoglycerate dehydrogenase
MLQKKKILIIDYKNYTLSSLKRLEKNFCLIKKNFNTKSEFNKFCKKFGFNIFAIFTEIGVFINDILVSKYLKNLKYIITPTTGDNHIEIKRFNNQIKIISLKKDIAFLKNIPSTAELSFFLILSLLRNAYQAISDVKLGYWRPKKFIGYELKDKTIGIIGLGRLGKMIAKFAISFGMKVIFYDIKKISYKNCKSVSLLKIFRNSDVISVNMPYDESTKNFINLNKFKMCRKQPIFINTSRGEIINENDLLIALKKKYISGAGLDVLEGDSSWKNSFSKNSPIFKYQKKNFNLLITPHIGGYTKEAILKTRSHIVNLFMKEFN